MDSSKPSNNELYESVLVEIEYPGCKPLEYLRVLENDIIIQKVLPFLKTSLIIYVCVANSQQTNRSAVCEYISSLYSRLWDEMLQQDALDLNCVVIGDVDGAQFTKRNELYAQPNLSAIFSYSTDVLSDEVHLVRDSLKLSNIPLINTRTFLQETYRSINNVYFFDDINSTLLPVFSKASLGGTFDRLHNGHRKLLTLAAASCTETLVIGITGDIMLQNKSNSHEISSYADREGRVRDFMKIVKPSIHIDFVELTDPFGPTITDSTIECIIVSSETIGGAVRINQIRESNNMSPLSILVSRRSDTATLSSTFLRKNKKTGT